MNQRDASFDAFTKIGEKKDNTSDCLFENYSLGVATGRDAWCYNASPSKLAKNARSMIEAYNEIVDSYAMAGSPTPVEKFVKIDPRKVSWNANLFMDLERGRIHEFKCDAVVPSIYRPFSKCNLYNSK